MLNGSFFLVADGDHLARSWGEAEAACNAAGATLANPVALGAGPHEMYLIAKLLEGHGLNISWVGGHRNGPSNIDMPLERLQHIINLDDGLGENRKKKKKKKKKG